MFTRSVANRRAEWKYITHFDVIRAFLDDLTTSENLGAAILLEVRSCPNVPVAAATAAVGATAVVAASAASEELCVVQSIVLYPLQLELFSLLFSFALLRTKSFDHVDSCRRLSHEAYVVGVT